MKEAMGVVMDPVDARTVKQSTTNERDDASYEGRVTLSILCASNWRYQPRGNTCYTLVS